MKSIRSILGQIRKADQKFDFFHEKDRVLIGVSGGKDSMVLLYALNQYRHFKCVNFTIVPVILDLGFPGFDAKPIKEYVQTLGLDLIVVDARDVYQILKVQQKDAPHLPCSICSRMKKAAINKAAKDLGCNKVAFAHHGDDAVETLFMNEIFGGRIATFQPKMFLERAGIEFIRPLILCHESEITRTQKEEKIPSFPSHCPNDGNTMRAEMKSMLKNIYHKYPSAKDNFFSMMENFEKEVLYYQDYFIKIERKDLALHPVISAKDSLLEQKMRKELGFADYNTDLQRFIVYRKNTPIGIFSYFKKNNRHIIHDLEFTKESKQKRIVIIKYIENTLKHFDCSIGIKIPLGKHDAVYQEMGYKKVGNYLIKKF